MNISVTKHFSMPQDRLPLLAPSGQQGSITLLRLGYRQLQRGRCGGEWLSVEDRTRRATLPASWQ